jgi:hypothetical protein
MTHKNGVKLHVTLAQCTSPADLGCDLASGGRDRLHLWPRFSSLTLNSNLPISIELIQARRA